MKISYSPEARSDLYQIKRYISNTLHNPIAADHIIERILKDCSYLKKQPYMGIGVAGKFGKDTDLRYLICGNQFIFYRIQNDKIIVTRILDGRTDYMRILFFEG